MAVLKPKQLGEKWRVGLDTADVKHRMCDTAMSSIWVRIYLHRDRQLQPHPGGWCLWTRQGGNLETHVREWTNISHPVHGPYLSLEKTMTKPCQHLLNCHENCHNWHMFMLMLIKISNALLKEGLFVRLTGIVMNETNNFFSFQ